MPEFKEKYINPFTDYGFKRLFGEEPSKNLLLDFYLFGNVQIQTDHLKLKNKQMNKFEKGIVTLAGVSVFIFVIESFC